jgi:hypothetical protein
MASTAARKPRPSYLPELCSAVLVAVPLLPGVQSRTPCRRRRSPAGSAGRTSSRSRSRARRAPARPSPRRRRSSSARSCRPTPRPASPVSGWLTKRPVGRPSFSMVAMSASITEPCLHFVDEGGERRIARAACVASGCSAATAQKVTPMMVSARVVNTHSRPSPIRRPRRRGCRAGRRSARRCSCRSSWPAWSSRARASRSSVEVVQQFVGVLRDAEVVAGISRFSTTAPVRQPRPSMTCSLASTVWSTGSQFTTCVFL